MGNLKVGDKIIITKVLTPSLSDREKLIGTISTIKYIDVILDSYPFLIFETQEFWVEGIPYSPLLEELM